MANMGNGRSSNGTFKQGHPGFKPKGSINEIQKVTKEKLGQFLIEKIDDLRSIYEKLSPKERAKLIITICDFFLPKQKGVVLEVEDERGRVAALFPFELPTHETINTGNKKNTSGS